jgi:3-dehydroquinate dehydratase I
MICLSISERSQLPLAGRVKLAEMRLDTLALSNQEIRKRFAGKTKLIATFRPGKVSDRVRKERLLLAIQAGAAFVDLELEAGAAWRNEIIKCAREHKCKVIVSYHNFKLTPSRVALDRLVNRCFSAGADIAKIAARVNSPVDNLRLLSLLKDRRPLVVTGMGKQGRITRLLSSLLGGLFTYAAPDRGRLAAPGQIRYSEMVRFLGMLQAV